MSKVWFITGTSRGFGRVWAEAALERGDRVAATARNVETLAELTERYDAGQLLPLSLDVTDKARVDEVVPQAHDHFGCLDIVVNNAGYGLFGAVEEITEQQARDQMEANFFGALWVTKAALPLLRAQGRDGPGSVPRVEVGPRGLVHRRSRATSSPSGSR